VVLSSVDNSVVVYGDGINAPIVEDGELRRAIAGLEPSTAVVREPGSGDRVYRVVAPVVDQWGVHHFSLVGIFSYAGVDRELRNSLWLSALILALGLGLTQWVSRTLARGITRDVDRLREGVQRIQEGHLEERVPVISNVGWAIISLSFFAGAFNVEIFRAGIEAVPESTKEASESLGFSRLQTYRYVVLPLAFRVCLPALNNNLVNLVKTTTQAFAIAVPELLYQSVTIWNDYPSAQYPTMVLVFAVYILLVAVLVFGMHKWERAMRIPGYGR
jgi:ABC-type amino acid transport system permease subunit